MCSTALPLLALATFTVACSVVACTSSSNEGAARERTLTLGAYTTPREVYGKAILPAFAEHWKATTGEIVRFEESYQASGAQARSIIGGLEADVAALSLLPDIEKLRAANLVTSQPVVVTRSLVVIGVRPGNPKNIRTWSDLTRDDVAVLTPNVRMSGGAMWNVAAIVGAAQREGTDTEALLSKILKRVTVFDKGARESMLTFESGVGDAIITYENEIFEARRAGKQIDVVIPPTTILIENPAVVVDGSTTAHGSADIAAAFVQFLTTPKAQSAFASFGYRPIDPSVPLDPNVFPTPGTVFTVASLGGWSALDQDVFAPGALYDRVTSP